MNNLKTLSIVFLMALFTVSCTEEISDELKNSESNATESNATRAVGNKIKLTHTMDENLSYHLHRIEGRNQPCEIEATGGNFSSSTYDKADNEYVADCILEVEELDLFFEGLNFELEVDEYLCEYVHYKPFKFFQYPVGATTQYQYKLECDSTCSGAQDGAGATFCAAVEGTYLTKNTSRSKIATFDYCSDDNYGTEALCVGNGGTWYPADTVFYNPGEASCQFDYTSSDGPNCDAGKTYTKTYYIMPTERNECVGNGPGVSARSFAACEVAGTFTEASCDDPQWDNPGDCAADGDTWSPDTCSEAGRVGQEACEAVGAWGPVAYCSNSSDVTGDGVDNWLKADDAGTESEDCGGSAYNCFSGPAIEHLSDTVYSGEIYENKDLTKFVKEWEIEPSISEDRATNRYIANFSRICSNDQAITDFDGINLTDPEGLIGSDIETHTPSPKDPFVITDETQYYMKQKVDYNNDGNDDYTVYADHPFKGVTEYNSKARSTVKPYYAFYCLDKARDIKAQIRLHVREWDRMFDKDEVKMDFVSDVDSGTVLTQLIDNKGYYNDDHAWNNYRDWDDFFENPVTTERKFTANKCGDVVNKPNPGKCIKENLAPTNSVDCLLLPTGMWLSTTNKGGICYEDEVAWDNEYQCELVSGNRWYYDNPGGSFMYNFPWLSI